MLMCIHGLSQFMGAVLFDLEESMDLDMHQHHFLESLIIL
jgi:hypothetical protein